MAHNPIDPKLVRRLADILRDTDLTEIEVEQGELKIRVSRTAAVMAAPLPVQTYAAPMAAAPAAQPAPAAGPPAAPSEAAAPQGEPVKSPMVGTVYLAANPGAEDFVQVGDRVTQGQTLLIIEAMKTMNPIPAPRAGVVQAVLVTNEQPVEFGEPLVTLE